MRANHPLSLKLNFLPHTKRGRGYFTVYIYIGVDLYTYSFRFGIYLVYGCAFTLRPPKTYKHMELYVNLYLLYTIIYAYIKLQLI